MEAYDLKKIEQLLRDFYYLTGMKTSLYDSAENEICYYPEKLCSFCHLLRQDAEMDARCRACDSAAMAVCKRTHKQYLYTCHAGLQECFSPIIYEGHIIGYIAIGQVKTHESMDFVKLQDRLPAAMRPALAEAFLTLSAYPVERLEAATRILDACTGYEYLRGLMHTAERHIDTRLDGYIGEHLRDDLSVQALCRQFHLSYKEIYDIFRTYFHATPADYVKTRRLSQACELLVSTPLPVHVVAKRCGMPDYNYFSKIFKRRYGTSPRAYRNTHNT